MRCFWKGRRHGSRFGTRRFLAAGRSANGGVGGEPQPLSARTIARVAPYLSETDRSELGIVDAAEPSADLAFAWDRGVLLVSVTFIDRASGARAPYAAVGAISPWRAGFVRFSAEYAAQLGARLLEAGFVPRAADGFALHGADRAAGFVR